MPTDEIENNIINQCQYRWDISNKRRWTKELIPDVKMWIERKHGGLNHYLTQFLSGHGPSEHYVQARRRFLLFLVPKQSLIF